MTNRPDLSRPVEVLALKVSYPGKALSPRQTRVAGHLTHCPRVMKKEAKQPSGEAKVGGKNQARRNSAPQGICSGMDPAGAC